MNSSLFVDPAIVSLSHSPSRPQLSKQKSTLEPGSALLKLLDSAMANAAKEKTPQSTAKLVNGLLPEHGQVDWVLTLVPKCKRDLPYVYSIQTLLEIHADPMVTKYDARNLPPYSFWHTKPKLVSEVNRTAGNLKRNRRANNPDSGNGPNSNAHSHDTARPWEYGLSKATWDRRPAGFLKQSELETMSRDRILQLLGENPEEDTPEWDTPVNNVSAVDIDMGSTVEDFERWKQQKRNEERRRNGEDVQEFLEVPKGNDVDSFFSFASSASDLVKRNSHNAETGQSSVKDSSKFSSFFGPSLLASRSGAESDKKAGLNESSVGGTAGRSLRFFKSESSTQSKAPPVAQHQYPSNQPQPSSATVHPATSDVTSQNFQRFQPGIPTLGIPGPGNGPPPGFPGLPWNPNTGMVPPPGLIGPTGGSNDNFFFSLLQKRNAEAAPDGKTEVQDGKNIQSRLPGDNQSNIPGNTPNDLFYGRPPPGMFVPGIPPPGTHMHSVMMQGKVSNGLLRPSNNYGLQQSGKAGPQGQPQQLQQAPQAHRQHLQQHQQPSLQHPPQGQMGGMPNEIPPWVRRQPDPSGKMPQPPHFGFPGQVFPPGLANRDHQGK